MNRTILYTMDVSPYRLEKVRLNSFTASGIPPGGWNVPPESLAKYGFYRERVVVDSAPNDDSVVCHFCRIKISNWEPTDSAYDEHLRWSPTCRFIRGSPTDNVPLDPNFVMPTLSPLPNDVAGTGRGRYQRYFTEEYWQDRRRQQTSREQSPPPVASREASSREAATSSATSSSATSSGTSRTTSPSPTVDITRNVTRVVKTVTTTETTETVSPIPASGSMSVCLLCSDNERHMVFLPCKHTVSCLECSRKLNYCPVCRGFIRGAVRIYLS